MGQDTGAFVEEGLNIKSKQHQPPRWARYFVEWYCKPELAEDLLGDLNEYFERNVEAKGPRTAKMIFVIDALKFFRTYTVRRPKFINPFISWLMIGSYIKTSGRNVMRNKLFSAINIVGLSISMSVGLLLIGLLHDLFSYDRFHVNGDRIIRVITDPKFREADWGTFASTSVKAGKLVQEKVTGVEIATMMRNGFEGDGVVGDKILPIKGLWAEPSFFKVFSFPLAAGDPATALTQPYSIVLTEQSAKKFFGDETALGQSIKFDTIEYSVTGVLKDIPYFSHVRFESLVSFSTFELQNKNDKESYSWEDIWSNYLYLLMPPNADLEGLQSQLNEIAKTENAPLVGTAINLRLQPLFNIALGDDLSNSIGPSIDPSLLWIVGGLAIVVILSACFNYTNLSIARSLRRFKEVGLRKAIGAGRRQVREQFLSEAVIISLAALALSLGLFIILRSGFISVSDQLNGMVRLELTPMMVISFIGFSILVGVVAGFLPAMFFSRVNIIQALRDTSSVKVFKHLTLRRGLVVTQYTFTLAFITATLIGYSQYKGFLVFDLGFKTENIVNVNTQGNDADIVVNEFTKIPEVVETSLSRVVLSIGNYTTGILKYKSLNDSTTIWMNQTDESYFQLHDHKFLAGGTFKARPTKSVDRTEVIVTEELLKKFKIANPDDPTSALGEQIILNRRPLSIVGVVKDFHYGKTDNKIEPVAFVFLTDKKRAFVNLKVASSDPAALMAKFEEAWKKIDQVHPIRARFYKDDVEESYQEFSSMLTIIGFLAFLAISIASMGLFGMVVFTTETRLKEISIRKVMGASSGNLIYLLSKGFVVLLSVSAVIALPATYIFFEQVILTGYPYHQPIGFVELIGGLVGVLVIAFIMIGTQTLKAARANPAQVLKSE